ncbi:MAG: zinc ribbon domain-containing protein [Candidatus Woesearchaeota archaeon]
MKCPTCRRTVAEGDAFCQACRNKIALSRSYRCHKCDQPVEVGDKYCGKCGIRIMWKTQPLAKGIAKSKFPLKSISINTKTIKIVLVFIILVAFLAGIGALILRISEGGSPLPSHESIVESIQGLQESICGNGIVESGEDSSNCCLDADCPSSFTCEGNACKKNAICGNGIAEGGETFQNCCLDAGCPGGQTCQNNTCIELKPEIKIEFQQTFASPSVTSLKAKENNVGQLTITNTGNDDASGIRITLTSPNGYFSEKTIDIGAVPINSLITKNVDLVFLTKALELTTEEDISITALITSYSSVNKQHSSSESFNMHIAGRNYINWETPQLVASWVTPTQPTIREFAGKATSGLGVGMSDSDPVKQKMAARWLFESMRAYGVHYVNDMHTSGDYIQFPYETLKNKAGDCDDNAILYAALLEAIGLKSFLMIVPTHIFAGYVDSKGHAVPIETTLDNFEYALSRGREEFLQYQAQSPLIYPETEWKDYPAVNLPEGTSINMPSITKQMGECELDFNLEEFWVMSVPVKFVNSGNAPGAGCAAVATYQNGILKDQAYACYILNPGETREETFQPDISILETARCESY